MEAKFKRQPAGYYLIFGLLAFALLGGFGLTTNTAAAGPTGGSTTDAPVQGDAPQATPTVCTTDYTVTTTTGVIVPATTFVEGSNCDDCAVPIALPFPVNFYETTYTSLTANSNGNLQFNGSNSTVTNTCLPAAGFGPTIFAYWDDLNAESCEGCGIYTSLTGDPGEQVFTIEYRSMSFDTFVPVNFAVVFYEADPNTFSIIYGQNPSNASVTVGVQSSSTGAFTEYKCNSTGGSIAPGTQLNFTQVPCTVATPTVTSTATSTNTPVPPTNTPTAVPPTATDTPAPTNTSTPVPPTATPTAWVCMDSTPICHRTGNGGEHTIIVSCDAVPEHLGHGDTIGACPGETPKSVNR
jgi:hypothetical protein